MPQKPKSRHIFVAWLRILAVCSSNSGATSYRVADGRLIDSSDAAFGYSHKREYRVLLFFSWRSSDLPKEEDSWLTNEW